MGTSHPPDPRWTEEDSPAERTLWRWAVEQLDDDVLVLPQVALTRGGRDREECEIDLVLIDPAHGITVVEVKGGTLEWDAKRATWRRMGDGAGREVRDPVGQAKRARSILQRCLDASEANVNTIALRWAVATPDCRLEAPGEPILPPDRLWDAQASSRLAELAASTQGPLTQGEQPLGADLASYLARYLRGRSVTGRAVASTAIDEHEHRVRVQTESHRNVLRQIWRNPHVLVRGSAGTGKTVLALEAAEAYATMGERVLLACWNVVLAEWLRTELRARLEAAGMDGAEVTDDPSGQVVVLDVGRLAQLGAAAAGQDRPEPAPGRLATAAEKREYWYEHLPPLLLPSVTGGEFDVIVLDEAQDLTDDWVLAVTGLVRRGGRFYAFADRQQDLFSADSALSELLEVDHELRENFRNSRQVAEFAARFGDIEADCLTGDGPEVEFVECAPEEVVDRAPAVARGLVKRDGLREEDVAVLWLFHNPWKGRSAELAAHAAAGGLVETNGASFKGMERPVVVLGMDVDESKQVEDDELRRSIYAAATRARSQLVVVGDLRGLAGAHVPTDDGGL